MRRKAIGVVAALVLLLLITVALAQQRRTTAPVPAVEQARLALIEGRYDQVAGIVQALDRQDPDVAVLIARADIARGRYKEAETLLRPVVDRAPTSEAALELGLLAKMLGRQDAGRILARVAAVAETTSDPRELARGARALRALERVQEANAAFRDAVSAAPRDPAIHTAWGDLFLEKYDNGEALKSYQAALKLDPKYQPALVGSARVLSNEDPPQAQSIAKSALEINPNDVGLHVFLAQEAVDSGKRDDARKFLQTALEVNPSSIEAHALKAGVAFLEDKQPEFDAEIAAALAVSPNFGEGYRVVAELASHNFRYDDAVALARKAIALDPGNPRILGDLGIHLLRTGDEAEARTVLEDSFKRDAFNRITYNLLTMLDGLDQFVTVRDGDVILKMHKDESPVMQESVLALAHEALGTLSKRYQFTPKGPILIEIFPKHDDFAVRTAGLPGLIGALGVCFGRVVTLDSPRARPGEFQWEATLWHELAHVITLQMSNHRVPRWLTEGISEYEEKLHRPDWARSMDMVFAGMLNRNETLKLRDLNAGFTDGRTITLAYYEASLLVAHIVSVYGDEGLRKLLRAYGQGLDTDAALKTALNTDLDELQVGFDQTLEKRFGSLRAALQMPDESAGLREMPTDALKTYADRNAGSYVAQMMLGAALRKDGRLDEAVSAFERAAALAPMAAGDDSPNAQIADIALARKDNVRAIAAFKALMAADYDNVELARTLAALLKETQTTDPPTVRPVYERITAIDPFDADAHAMLGRLSMQANDPAAAVRAFKAVVALKPVDPALAHTELAESYFKNGNRTEARRQTLAALEIAPSYERAQNLLLTLAEGRP